ncbi:MAG TPA: PD-(D/E)XK nuclease family protein, partial [Candidatus Eisenbacteria bacterium]|nr:PD-(D/E)XK nuclease family protein [Candidatus Eisenbacteria bacterium]
LEPYAEWVKEIFAAHAIPTVTFTEAPLLQSPPSKAVVLLLTLADKNYFRTQFIDLVASPHFKFPGPVPADLEPRPDLWDLLTRRLGITKGPEEWARLERHLHRAAEFSVEKEGEEEPGALSVAAEQIRLLWTLFSEIYRDLSRLPLKASWREYGELWKDLIEKYVDFSEPEPSATAPEAQTAKAAVSNTLDALSQLEAVEANPSRAEFTGAFQRALERATLPLAERNVAGACVLDAMAARGSRFRALFILGLNEGLFPRAIREDAFLRDRSRRVIETVLGCKVSPKLAAFDEEKLLFELLIGAAGERLYGLYHRYDDTGTPAEPSWYLTELERAFAPRGGVSKTFVPRGIREKERVQPFFSDDWLLPEELAVRLGVRGEDPEPLLEHFPELHRLYAPGSRLLEEREATHGRLTAYDGMTGYLAEYWRSVQEKGLGPTVLERYGRCPFQFFAVHVLDLRPLERPERQAEPDPSEKGKLIHAILKLFYERLLERGFFRGPGKPAAPGALLEASAREIFAAYEREHAVGYPLLWEITQSEIITLLDEYVARDLEALAHSSERPVAFELEVRGRLPSDWPEPAANLPIAGTIDRLDFDEQSGRYRVIDYKFTTRKRPAGLESSLALAALRGERLQAPFYLFLARSFFEQRGTPPSAGEAAFCFLAPRAESARFPRVILSAGDWTNDYVAGLGETVALFVRHIRDGYYFIHPGEACRVCEAAHVCRKNHLPVQWRAANDPLSAAYEQVLQKGMGKD